MDLELYGVSAVLLIIGIVQLAKSVGFNSKYGGILAVALGVLASVSYTLFAQTDVIRAVVIGLALGLSADGLYSTVKNSK
ncbi:MAG: hypothetical protein KGZ75_13695 [Syntrophomonadaceae bacterium]|nr:hypothetical protein [Syntrophomonadaceae bacterium]